MKGKSIFIFLVTCILCISITGCKRKKPGCMDAGATNFDFNAELSDGSCIYTPIIADPSFEFPGGSWSTQNGNGFSSAAWYSNTPDGFMPTNGQYFFKCVPYIGHETSTNQTFLPNTHFTGFYFDYRYVAKAASSDSVLWAAVELEYDYVYKGSITWTKTISETPASFGGFPNITVEKRDEYMDLPYTDGNGLFFISTSVSAGTFTFEIDNIRLVQKK